MHGITRDISVGNAPPFGGRVVEWMRSHRKWMLAVLLPTLLVTAYYYVIASDQYESEAHFLVRSTNPTPPTMGIGAALGLGGGAGGGSSGDSASVADYMNSHDALAELQKRINIVGRYTTADADPVSRLRPADPSPERLLSYYRSKVEVRADPDTGVVILRVRSFSPQDSYLIAKTLLQLGEERVNALNQRARDSTLGVARNQLADAEQGVTDIQRQLTAFRKHNSDFNPQVTGTARVELVSSLQQQLAVARAQAAAMASHLSASSPQLVATQDRVRSLAAQVAAEQGRITSGTGNVATSFGTYEELELRQGFAAKRYDAAASALAEAREQIIKQQLFVVQVVKPNVPGKALFPQRLKIIATIFVTLWLIYGIAWLIAAGVREHAA